MGGRTYTPEEVRDQLLSYLRETSRYWARVKLEEEHAANAEMQARLDGLVFSILVMLDGCAGGMPAFDLTPSPHPTDCAFHRERGENWYDERIVINADTQLHELWHTKLKHDDVGAIKFSDIKSYVPATINVDGLVDSKGIQYIGKATQQLDGTWRALANVGGALCLVEVNIRFEE